VSVRLVWFRIREPNTRGPFLQVSLSVALLQKLYCPPDPAILEGTKSHQVPRIAPVRYLILYCTTQTLGISFTMNQTTISNGNTISSPRPAAIPPQFKQTAPTHPPDLLPHAPQYVTRNSIPNTPLAVSAISAALGALAAGGLITAAQPVLRLWGSAQWRWARPQLGLYVSAMGMFHLWEFWTTAGWNPQKLSVDGEQGDYCSNSS